MSIFSKSNIEKLKEVLYNSYVHDAKIKSVKYECGDNSLNIEMFNSIFQVIINVIFLDIQLAFLVSGNNLGSRETVISLTLEEDYSYLQNYVPEHRGKIDHLYLLFQMLSGDELHIVSKEVVVETIK